MTYDKGKLLHPSIYRGYNHVIVGNGTRLKISHVGDTTLYSPHGKLHLHDVLVVPDIKKNLISVTKLTKDNSCLFEFHSFGFKIKDQTTGTILAMGHRKGGLYALEEMGALEALVAIKSGKAPVDLWQQRLGHPNSRLLHVLDSKKFIDVSSWLKNENICTSCQMGKSCRLPFSLNDKIDTAPLVKIHCDLWGPAPIASVQHFKFYVIFIDDHSRFTWFYPLKHKSDFFKTFLSFQRMVENQFNSKIKIFQCDGGGEFELQEFLTHLDTNGIVKHVSCPGTPEQNGIAERKHRHLVETGLTMLLHAQLPQYLWVDAFTTAVYLINRLPSSVLQMKTSFYKLYGTHPTYASLKVFGCRCFPYLRDYSKNKFGAKSYPCVFLGYSPTHKGYRCLHPPSKRVYLSRHVVFDETIFPYANPKLLYSSSPCNGTFSSFSEFSNDFLQNRNTRSSSNSWVQSTPSLLGTPHTAMCPVPPAVVSHVPSTIVPPTHLLEPIPPVASSHHAPADTSIIPLAPQIVPLAPATSNAPSVPLDLQPMSPAATSSSTPHEDLVTSNATHTSSSSPIVAPHGSTNSRLASSNPEFYIDLPIAVPPTAPPLSTNVHPMLTRKKARDLRGLVALKDTDPTEPKSVKTALQSPHWFAAMCDEISALKQNQTWELVPRQDNMNVVGSRWVFKTKLKSDGSIDRFKARLVAQGFSQSLGIDFLETFSPVIKPQTIWLVLSLALIHGWSLRQLDVKNAFLHGSLKEIVYMEQPPGFSNSHFPNHVCRLQKALYGLKQAPRAWFDRFSSFLFKLGFTCSTADSSLFIFRSKNVIILLLVYVDDIIVTGNTPSLLLPKYQPKRGGDLG